MKRIDAPMALNGALAGLVAITANPYLPDISLSIFIGAIGAFVSATSLILWVAMKYSFGIRLHWSQEKIGGDLSELGVRTYNLEFNDDSDMRR